MVAYQVMTPKVLGSNVKNIVAASTHVSGDGITQQYSLNYREEMEGERAPALPFLESNYPFHLSYSYSTYFPFFQAVSQTTLVGSLSAERILL